MDFPGATHFSVNNEDCDLQCWCIGSGPLLLFIPGGNGHGRQFGAIMAAMSGQFTCATFDRRQMSSSKVAANKPLDLQQQGRDIVAIIKGLQFKDAILFGSSGGGILGYSIAASYPEVVRQLITHEAPIFETYSDPQKWKDFNHKLVGIKERDGWRAAQDAFQVILIGYHDEGVPKTKPPEQENVENHWENEVSVFAEFQGLQAIPLLEKVKSNGTRVGVMRGARSRDAMYAESASGQAAFLGCPEDLVPGHHQGFEVEVDAFVPHLVRMIELLRAERPEGAH